MGLGQETSVNGFGSDGTSLLVFALQQELSLCCAPKQHLKYHGYSLSGLFLSCTGSID